MGKERSDERLQFHKLEKGRLCVDDSFILLLISKVMVLH